MRRQLDDVRSWGEPIAALWASEAAIYGRFGYGAAVPGIVAKSDPRRFVLKGGPATNVTVRLVDADEALRALPGRSTTASAPAARACSRARTTWWKDLRLADHEELAARREPEVLRRGRGRRRGAGVRDVPDQGRVGGRFLQERGARRRGCSRRRPAVEQELWRFLHAIDLTVTVDVFSLDPASSLFLCVRDPRALGLRLADALWLRLVDLDAALKARSYKPGESVVLEVTDELCPWNAGRYRVGDDAGRTEDTADLALDVADLASAYLGAFDFHRLVHSGRADERRDGAAEAATLLFRTDLPPYCPEVF